MSDETPLITKVHQVKEIAGNHPKRAIVLRVQTDTETGQLVLWISGAAGRELAANLTHILKGKDYQ